MMLILMPLKNLMLFYRVMLYRGFWIASSIGNFGGNFTGAVVCWDFIGCISQRPKTAITTTITDVAGNTSDASAILTITVDTAAPTCPSTTVVNTCKIIACNIR
jgi:hypothetical protein